MQMRPSRVLRKLRSGEIVNCFKSNLGSPRLVELIARIGFDCLWLDMEHTPDDYHVIEAGIWAARGYDMDVMVRVARGGYSDYVRPLEMDAAGIMVPHIMSATDAKNVARMVRFHPIGRRPADGGNADGAYCGIPFKEYIRQANEQRFIVVQIEDPEPMEELDQIAEVPGIDMLFFGPGDFSHAIGVPGELNHPKVAEARRRVAEVARAHGKFAGTVGSPETMADLAKLGYQFINLGSDVTLLQRHCRQMLDKAAQITGAAGATSAGAHANGPY